MTFDDFNHNWPLWVRLFAAVSVNAALVLLAIGSILRDERLAHVVGGGWLVFIIPRLLRSITDVVTEWPERNAVRYVRPKSIGIAVAINGGKHPPLVEDNHSSTN